MVAFIYNCCDELCVRLVNMMQNVGCLNTKNSLYCSAPHGGNGISVHFVVKRKYLSFFALKP